MKNLATFVASLGLALFAVPGVAQVHPDFTGTWELDASKSEQHVLRIASATWTIEQRDNSIHVTEVESGNAKKIELRCSTDGKDCEADGEKAKASFWFNGAMLVEMETRGDRVNRYRMKLSDDNKTLTVEISFIVPQADKSDVLVFRKH